MQVYIGNLPGQATIAELRGFLGKINLHADFNCHRGFDAQHDNYYYFIARTKTNAEGEALIAQLNGKRFLDKVVVARPFIARSAPPAPESTNIDERRVDIHEHGEQLSFDI